MSDSYKIRIIEEYNQLKERLEKLSNFINNDETILNCPLELLTRQRSIMQDYLAVLEERAKYEDINLG